MSYSSAVALQMPSSYVPMSTEEMEYLEGGAKKYLGTISASTCNRLAAITCITGSVITGIAALATIISGIAAVMSCGTLSAAVAIAGGITGVAAGVTGGVSGYLWLASTYKGLNVYFDTRTYCVTTSIKK